MSLITKSKNLVTTLWSHKKKTLLAVVAAAYGFNWIQTSNRYL